MQDIEAHLLGDIPNRDIDDLKITAYPTLRSALFKLGKRANYSTLCVAHDEIKNTIFKHPEFVVFGKKMDGVFNKWRTETIAYTKEFDKGLKPKRKYTPFRRTC